MENHCAIAQNAFIHEIRFTVNDQDKSGFHDIMTIKKRLSGFRKISQYNPTLAGHLANVLASGGILAKVCNAGLWLFYHAGVSIIQLKQRALQRRHGHADGRTTATEMPASGAPWQHTLSVTNPVRKGVLLLAELSLLQCKRYRVDQKVEGFAMIGEPVVVHSWTDSVGAIAKLQLCRLVILYRVPAFPGVQSVIQEARRLGLPVLFDIDDLVFDVEEYSNNSNLRALSQREQDELLNGARLYHKMLQMVDHAVASTPVLSEHMRKFCKGTVHLVENAIDSELLTLSNSPALYPNDGVIRVFYGSGTKTHDKDFIQAESALVAVLEKFEQCQLVILGHLNLSPAFDPVAHKVHRIGFISPSDYYQAIRQFSINIAPLEAGSFNDAKSNIKFLEASVFGIPTVASPAAAFRQVIRHGENGFIAETHDEWFDALCSLISNEQLRSGMGQQARQDAVSHYALPVLAERQMACLLKHATTAPAARKHVLMVNLLFAPVSFGGATIVAEQLAKHLSCKPETQVSIFTGTFDDSLSLGEMRRYEWNGMNVFAIRVTMGDPLLEYDNPAVAGQFARLLDAIEPDIVHFHSIQHLGASMCRTCSEKTVPYAITLHDAWWLCDRQFMVNKNGFCGQKAIDPVICASCVDDTAASYRRRFYLHRVLQEAHLLLAPSQHQRQLYIDSGVPPERVFVNRNGVMLPDSSRPRELTDKPGHEPVFAYLGGRAAHKGYFWLKSAFESIQTSVPYTLRLVDVESRFGLSRMRSDDWKITGRLEVVPPFTSNEVDAFYDEVDVLLFPSQCVESFGLTIREALARDKWVITTESGGPTEEVVNGENGIIVPMHDQAAFRAAVEQCLSNPDFHVHYRNPHRDVIRGFAEQADELNELLEGVLAEHRRSKATSQ